MSRHLNQIFMALHALRGTGQSRRGPDPRPSGPLWTESSNAKTPADIARLNDHMNNLAEKLKPALVQVRVRRAAERRPRASSSPVRPKSAAARARAS